MTLKYLQELIEFLENWYALDNLREYTVTRQSRVITISLRDGVRGISRIQHEVAIESARVNTLVAQARLMMEALR